MGIFSGGIFGGIGGSGGSSGPATKPTDPIISPGAGQVIAAGVDVVGGVLQSAANFEAQTRAQDFGSAEYGTRYQTTMEDMRKAGLNPILAYQQGVGAQPKGQGLQGLPNVLSGAASTARGANRMVAEIGMLKETKKLRNAETWRTWAQERAQSYQGDLNRELSLKAVQDREVAATTAKLMKTGLPAAKAQERLDKMPVGETLRMWNRIIRSVTGRDATGARR